MREMSSIYSAGKGFRPKILFHTLYNWFIAPSSKIQEPDQRRQASLLSSFLLGTIFLAVFLELFTIAFIEWENYTGYRQTIVIAIALGIIYGISRTHRVRLAAILTVIVASAGVYYIGWADPRSVLGGLLDFMILPLWLGGLYLGLGELTLLIIGCLASILVFPSLTSQVTLDEVLVGPFSFIFSTSILLLIITQHRNRLENDRRGELIEKEKLSQRQAARAEALLRVAERLNAQLDLDTLSKAIAEEVARSMHTPVSLVTLYDQKQKVFHAAAAVGISPRLLQSMTPFPRALYDQTTRDSGTVFGIPDLQVYSNLPNINEFKNSNFRSLAFVAMEYEDEVIGTLSAVTAGEIRHFTEDELLLLHGLADQAALAIVNTRLYKDAHRRLEHLQALRTIDIAISSNHNLQETLKVLLEQITSQLHVDATAILLLDEEKQRLEFGACMGFQTPMLRYTSLQVGQGMAGQAALQRQIVSVHNLRTDPHTLSNASLLMAEGFVSYYAVPLVSQNEIKGVLEIFHRDVLDPDNEWIGFLETLAGQAAIAVESTSLFEDLRRTNDELIKAYDSTIEGWSHALDLRDKETEGHTQRVTQLTLELAQAHGFKEKDLLYVRWGALLHDIGKMGIPDRILLKEGALTDEEWIIMRQHPVYAHDMLRSIPYLHPSLDIPYSHHERWDGTGYPRGLKAEEIPLVARLFSIVDVWDALTSDRPYRAAWSPEKTLTHIRQGSGSHFDPRVVEVFIDLIDRKSRGVMP
jgi:putative nucleotidyltransferase with HDIG domain